MDHVIPFYKNLYPFFYKQGFNDFFYRAMNIEFDHCRTGLRGRVRIPLKSYFPKPNPIPPLNELYSAILYDPYILKKARFS
jgi:hypothetical protein